MVLNKFRKYFNPYLETLAASLDRAGVRPWHLSLLGLTLAFISMLILMFIRGNIGLFIALFVFLVSGLMDALDGQLARLQARVSAWGAFYDSVIDRASEIFFIFGLLYAGLLSDTVAYCYIVTALLISYCRSRGESLGVSLKGVGLMERAERILAIVAIILIYLFFYIPLDIPFLIITILNVVTILARVLEVHAALTG